MKKIYEKPAMEVTEFRFSEHIAASGGGVNNCYWGSGASWSHFLVGCTEQYHEGTPGWVGLTG